MIYAGPFAPRRLTPPRVWPAPSARRLPGALRVTLRTDAYTGDGVVSGDAVNVGPPEQPVSRRIRLFDERTGLLIRETWSDKTSGMWAFPHLLRGIKYTVVAYDHTGYYNGWVRTGVTADPAS